MIGGFGKVMLDDPQPHGVKTIVDIARLAGVAPSAVSRSLAGKPGGRAETRRRIDEIAKACGFSINLQASDLRRGRGSRHPAPRASSASAGLANDRFLDRVAKSMVDLAIRSSDQINIIVEHKISDNGQNQEHVTLTFMAEGLNRATATARYRIVVSKIMADNNEAPSAP